MGKKNRSTRIDLSQDDAPSGTNAFAALAGLRDRLPPGVEPPTAKPVAAPAAPKGGRVILRKKKKGHAGKTVTRVEGLPAGSDLDARIKTALGTGARREGGALTVQGDQRERLKAMLEAEGYRVVIGS